MTVGYQRLTVIIGIVFIVAISSCSKQSKPERVLTVPVMKLHSTSIPLKKTYIGISQSVSSVDIRARVEGFLQKKNFTEGKPVKKGQLIYVIDPRPYQAKLNQAQGQLSRSIASRDYQSVQFLRYKQLVAKGDISKSNYDQTAANLKEAEAQVEVDTANVQDAQINLGYCFMYSPFDGIISKKYVDVGNLVGAGENTLLANVVELNPIYIEFSPSVNDFSEFLKYRQNMPFKASASFPLNDKLIFKGQVDLVNNQADAPTSTILMRALMENPEQLIIPGVYLNITLTLSPSTKVLMIPASAVIKTQEKRSVFIVGPDNKIASRNIIIEQAYQTNEIISSGLKEGDLLVTSALQKVQPGMTVNPKITTSTKTSPTTQTKPSEQKAHD